MFQDTPAWREHVRKRMRTNAHLAIRHDAWRFMPPGSPRYVGKDVVNYFWPEQKNDVHPAQVDDVDQRRECDAELTALLRMRSDLAWIKFEMKLRRLLLEAKAGFNRGQPRWPKGRPGEGGRWSGGSGGASSPKTPPAGIGHNQGPPLVDQPTVPKTKPSEVQLQNNVARNLARSLGRAIGMGTPTGFLLAMIRNTSWLNTNRASIESYQDPPKSLEELQNVVSGTSKPGYHDHHVVEQNSAREDEKVDAPENLVRIPHYKHEEITTWYATKNDDAPFGGRPPREYLQDKDWDERRRMGLDALRKFGVLRP
jgi:hypothetical protein